MRQSLRVMNYTRGEGTEEEGETKLLRAGCRVSLPGVVLLSWAMPGGAMIPEATSAVMPLLDTGSDVAVEEEEISVQAQNAPVPAPPESLPPEPSNSILQPAPVLELPDLEEEPPLESPSSMPEPAPVPIPEITVQRIEVTGSTVFEQSQLNPILQQYEGRSLSSEELEGVADAITQLYLNQGYLTSRAVVLQGMTNGVVEIRVIEGSLEKIEVEGTQRLNPDYVRSRVQLGAGTPLNTSKLEEQLRLLRANPLFENVEASLKAGTQLGKSIVVVRVTEANPIEARVSVDNYSPPSVGSERLGVSFRDRNLTGIGDELAASYYHTTTSGADVLDLSYRLPLNAKDGTLQLRVAPSRNRVTQSPLDALDIRGKSQLYEISYRQPLVRSPREELAVSVGFAYQDGQTFTFAGPTPFGIGPEADGTSRTSVIKLGQEYVRRDVQGAWAVRSQFNIGTGLLNATTNPDPIPDGQFFSWLGQVQRVQVLNPDNFLILQADVQLTPDSLLPSQQFVIGGGQSLRGYRQNVRAGDNGIRFSVEDRITLERNEAGEATFQLAPFFDMGGVWNVSDNPNQLQRQRFLAGVGVGLIWQPLPKLNLRLDYGLPLVNLDDRGTNAQDDGFYFSVDYKL
jgi:hemolysin activation/secretion protein